MNQPLPDLNAVPSPSEQGGLFTRYLAILAASFTVFAALLMVWGLRGRDHFAQIPLNGDMKWYRNYSHMATREMQDRDVFFHGIGQSVENLKKADIVLLGHSVFQFGIDNTIFEEFQKKHNIRIYNLTNPGIASGAFIQKIIKKWGIKPKIWIINADDYPANFFNPEMDDFFANGRNSSLNVVKESWLRGYLQAASRGIRWRIEDMIVAYGPNWLKKPPYPFMKGAVMTLRNLETGNFNVDQTNGFLQGGQPIQLVRPQDCHVSDVEKGWAKEFIAGIGGTTLLTLAPYERWCPQRVEELADSLGIERFFPKETNYPVFDGTHMAKEGAVAYTADLLSSLEQTRAFQLLKGLPDPGPVRRMADRPDPLRPVNFCVPNTNDAPLYVSERVTGKMTTHIIAPGEILMREGIASGILCSATSAFRPQECPNPSSPVAMACQNPGQPVHFCVPNTTDKSLSVSVRFRGQATDYIVPPGETLEQKAYADGQVCSDTGNFNRNQCPNRNVVSALKCPEPEPVAPVCIANAAQESLFVSMRSKDGVTDHVVAPGDVLKVDGAAKGQVCSSTTPFNSNQCPNARSQSAAPCP